MHILISNYGIIKSVELEITNPITILYGANYSGKSTLVDAIRFAFTGQDLRKLRKANTHIEIDMPPFKLKRTYSKLEVYHNGILVNRTIPEGINYLTRNYMDINILNNFGFYSPTNSFFDRPDAEKKYLLLSAFIPSFKLPLDIDNLLTKLYEHYTKQQVSITSDIAHTTAKIEGLKFMVASLQDRITTIRKSLHNYSRHSLKFSLNVISQKLEKAKLELDKITARIKYTQNNIKTIQDNITTHQTFLRNLTSDITSLTNKQQFLQTRKAQLTKELNILASSKCPVCLQPVKAPELITQRKTELNTIQSEFSEIKSLLENKHTRYKEIENKIAELTTKLNTLYKQLAELQHTESLKQKKYSTISSIYTTLKDKDLIIKQLLDEETQLLSQLEQMNTTISQASEQLTSLAIEQEIIEYLLKFYNKDGFLSYFIDILVNQYNTILKYLGQFLDINVQFVLQGNINSNYSRNTLLLLSDKGIEYKYLSSGERKRAILLVLLALRYMTKLPFNYLFLDELFENVDNEGMLKMLYLLQQVNQLHIFIISHTQQILEFVDNADIYEMVNGNCIKLHNGY